MRYRARMQKLDQLILAGHGKMGSALLARWRECGIASRYDIISPNHSNADTKDCIWHRDLSSLKITSDAPVIVFAVKPALLATLLPDYAKLFAGKSPIFLSVAAGKDLAGYHAHLGADARIIRTMPNTPSRIGEGMSLLCATADLDESARTIATTLMQACGQTCWLDETQMDAATAVSGCGPAYFYLFMQGLVEAAMAEGLSEEQAIQLTLQTAKGSIALATTSQKSLEEQIKTVASPGGATQAALDIYKGKNALSGLTAEAVKAAITRAKSLNNQ